MENIYRDTDRSVLADNISQMIYWSGSTFLVKKKMLKKTQDFPNKCVQKACFEQLIFTFEKLEPVNVQKDDN